ncbi:MAG: hypothetical protein EPO42_04010 [Gallionellaceae bacterium]|nr:MAG: hypothetical protein EPO42_04010 [Gallionellaceae bacterium]
MNDTTARPAPWTASQIGSGAGLNYLRTSSKYLGVLAAALTGMFLSVPAASASVAGQVQFASGNVQITTVAGQTKPLKKGDNVNEGDSITTAPASSAQIKTVDGGFVAIRPDTQMKFDKFVFSGKTDGSERGFFSLVKGGFRAVTGLVGRVNKQNYKIYTPAATIGIRGTDHETFVVPVGNPMAAAGAYSKVNVGETTLTTNLGTVNVLPNQMGFAGGMNEPPKLAPVNTNLFTVSASPTKTIKEKEQEKKAEEKQEQQKAEKQETKDDKKTEKTEQAASDKKGDKQEARQETKQEAKQEARQESAPAAKQEAKQEAAPAAKRESAPVARADAVAPVKAAAAAVAAVADAAPAPASPAPAAPQAAVPAHAVVSESIGAGTSLRVAAMVDPSSAGPMGGVASPAPARAPAPVTISPMPAVRNAELTQIKMTDTSGNAVNVTTQSVSTANGVTQSVGNVAAVISTTVGSSGAPLSNAVNTAAALPPISVCISAPTTAGCGLVLPGLASCMSAPNAQGCSVVLPGFTACLAAPSTAGCSAVLPTLATCTSTPTTAGCSAVLPSASTCASVPSTPGCSAVVAIPACASTPAGAGCSAAYTANRVAVEEASSNFSGWGTVVKSAGMVYVTGAAGGTSASGALSAYTDHNIGGGFSHSITIAGGTASSANATSFAATGIQYGAWSGYTSITQSDSGALGNNNGNGTRSWMYGPQGYLDAAYFSAGTSLPTGAMAGTFTYQLDGSTAPFNSNTGVTGTLTSASLTANFVAMTLNANVALTMPGNQNWGASATNQPFSQLNGGQFWATPTVTYSSGAGVALAPCTTCSGWLAGAFTGQNWAGALLSYQLGNTTLGTGNWILGQTALSRNYAGNANPAVANGIAAPTGSLVVADSWSSVGVYPVASTTTTGNVLTHFVNANTATSINCPTCTATAAGQVATSGIYYGDWTKGTYTQSWISPAAGAAPYYWITGPEAGPVYLAQSLTGTASFAFDSGRVSNANGVAGTVQGTTALTVNFTKQTVGINLDVSIADTAATPVAHAWKAQTLPGNEAPLTGSNGIGSDAFHASGGMAAANAGAGLLTVTVDGAAPATAFADVSGQLTGTGLNGAIMSFSLTGQITAAALTQSIQGVAAFSSAGSPIATPHQYVAVAYFDAASSKPLLGFDANNSTRATRDATGNLTQFDSSFIKNGASGSYTVAANTSTLTGSGSNAATGISWGTWKGGVINSTNRATGAVTAITNPGSLHWITEPVTSAAVTLPLAGTFSYTKVGGTLPTDNLGSAAGTLNTASLSANFTAQIVKVALNATVNGATLDAVALSAPIIQNTVFYADTQTPSSGLTVTCTGTSCGANPGGIIVGKFTGAGAAGVAVSYGLQHGANVISGVAAFGGQTFVTPTLSSCMATPTDLGCSAVLPSLAACTATPATPGCVAVLPTVNPAAGNYVRSFVAPRALTGGNGLWLADANNASIAAVAETGIVLDSAAGNVTRMKNIPFVAGGGVTPIANADVSWSGGVAKDIFHSADGSVAFGRREGGSVVVVDLATPATVQTISLAQAGTMVGPTSSLWAYVLPPANGYVQNLGGAATYTMTGSSTPYDSMGGAGVLNSASFSADFTAQTIGTALNVTMSTGPLAGGIFAASAANVPIVKSGFSTLNTSPLTVSCTVAAACTGNAFDGYVSGSFAGTAASNVLMNYGIAQKAAATGNAAAPIDLISGNVAFNTATSPSPAPNKAVALTLQDGYGWGQIWNSTFTAAPANINTAVPTPSFTVNWGGGATSAMSFAGATGAVNGSATTVAGTGIQFGRYASVSSLTQSFTGTFGNNLNGIRPGLWAYGVSGYLDTPTTLSAATGAGVTGTFGYVLDGTQAAPIAQNGSKGVLNALSLTANFATNTLNAAVKATTGAAIWNASATGMPIFGTRFSVGNMAAQTGVTTAITRGVLGTETCLTCSFNIYGGFTGQNYAGAVVAYNLWDSTTGVDGVAAMTRTGGTVGGVANPTVAKAAGTLAPTTYEVAAAGAGVGGGGNVSSVTVTAANVLTSYGSTTTTTGGAWSNSTAITCTTCSGQLATDFANTGIRMGTWDVGTSAISYTNALTTGPQLHWIAGPAASGFLVESLLGTATYALDGGTTPTSQKLVNGVPAAAVTGTLSNASLAVDFAKQAAGINFTVVADGHTWVVSSLNTPIGNGNSGSGATAFKASSRVTGAGALSVTLDGVAATGTSGQGSFVAGQLTGAALNGALFQYELTAIIPSTFNTVDEGTRKAPSATVTAPVITGGAVATSFPVGVNGTLAPLAATATSLVMSAGNATSMTTTGGMALSVPTLTATAPGNYRGTAATGESVSLQLYGSLLTGSGALGGGLQYANFGEWQAFPNVTGLVSPASLTGPFTGSTFAGGQLLTTAAAMPVGITATYTGIMRGGAQDSTTNVPYGMSGVASLTANFTSGAVSGSMTAIGVSDRTTGVPAGNFNDLALAGMIASNGFSGSVTAGAVPAVTPSPVAVAAATVGTTSGHFYGPNANEVSGLWSLTSGTIGASGAFGAANGTSANQASQVSVNGVAALRLTSVNGAAGTINPATVSSRLVAMTFTDPVKGYQVVASMNNSTRVAVDAVAPSANVTGFDIGNNGNGGGINNVYASSKAVAIDAAVVKNDTGADAVSGITWGRWTGGNLTFTDKITAVATTMVNTNTHWIAGPTTVGQVVLPVTGTFNYVLAGGSKPTDNLGNAGTLNSATLAANFTAQTVNVGVTATVNAVNYVSTGTNLPINQAQFSSNGNGGTFTATANGATAAGFVGGVFTGATGNGAAVAYGFQNGATTVNGVAAFHR